jgi:hypothetical protein
VTGSYYLVSTEIANDPDQKKPFNHSYHSANSAVDNCGRLEL